ncbi:hypothetical protein HYU14_07290 [Candidatus Woesearchaeota archaeon]|nr:hypothetical protein [Candidatus Woesearchaeota archaeon]
MMRTGGARRKSRHMLLRHYKERGKISLSKYFQSFKDGDRVQLLLNSASPEGTFFRRFYGKSGIVTGKRGRCFEIALHDRGNNKTIIVHPIHLRRLA